MPEDRARMIHEMRQLLLVLDRRIPRLKEAGDAEGLKSAMELRDKTLALLNRLTSPH